MTSPFSRRVVRGIRSRLSRLRWDLQRRVSPSERARGARRAPHFTELNDRHRGETVFVLGAGPQLSELTDEQVAELERRVCIGVNWTIYKVVPTYFLSAYVGHVRLAQLADLPCTLLCHMRPVYERALLPGVLPLRRRPYKFGEALPPRFAEPEPVLLTRRNAALGASHLALILGARRIVYVGVEQRNRLHYFQLDPTAHARIADALPGLRGFPLLGIDHPYESYERIQRALAIPTEEAVRTPFYEVDHRETFETYVAELGRHGVEIVSTVRESVITDAGGRYLPLDLVLADESAGS